MSLGLDIIGLGVFNYDFKSINKESPVIKVCFSIGHLRPRYCEKVELPMHVRRVHLNCCRLARLRIHVQAVYGVLKEAEHRSTFYIPYWNIPITRYIVPRQRKFRADLEVINDCLDGLIARAKQTRQADDVEALQARDYSKVCISFTSFLEVG